MPQIVFIVKRPASVAAPLKVRLKQATEETGGKSEIGKEIFHADPRWFRNNYFVSLRNGFERPEIQFVVKLMHGSIEGFQRVGNFYFFFLKCIVGIVEIIIVFVFIIDCVNWFVRRFYRDFICVGSKQNRLGRR